MAALEAAAELAAIEDGISKFQKIPEAMTINFMHLFLIPLLFLIFSSLFIFIIIRIRIILF